MGPSQICGCAFREPRVFEIAHMDITTNSYIQVKDVLSGQLCFHHSCKGFEGSELRSMSSPRGISSPRDAGVAGPMVAAAALQLSNPGSPRRSGLPAFGGAAKHHWIIWNWKNLRLILGEIEHNRTMDIKNRSFFLMESPNVDQNLSKS